MSKPEVVKLAQPGYDVKTAGDENLIYNSNWPVLKIYKQGTFTVSGSGTPITAGSNKIKVTDHDLGYIPMFWIIINDNIGSYSHATPFIPDGNPVVAEDRAEFNGPTSYQVGFINPVMTLDGLYIEFITTVVPTPPPIKITYYIFTLDIRENYIAPIIKTGRLVGPRGSNTVFKIAKEGKDVSSHRLEDYVVHSRARSPLIHQVFHGNIQPDPSFVGGYGVEVFHNLGYSPVIFAYAKTDGISLGLGIGRTQDAWMTGPAGDPTDGFQIDDQKIRWNGFAINGLEITFVILKDPFELDVIAKVIV